MDDLLGADEFSSSRLNRLAWAVSAGTADQADVRRVLELYYALAFAHAPIPDRLTAFVAESFGRFLGHKGFYGPDECGAASLDAAFGLVRGCGRPAIEEEQQVELAAVVVRARLTGKPHQAAVAEAAESCGVSVNTVSAAWRDRRDSAVLLVRSERPPGTYPWTASEKPRLLKMQPSRRKRNTTV